MSNEHLIMNRIDPPEPRKMAPAGKVTLFAIPSIVVTVVAVTLFAQLRGFTMEQFNRFTVTLLAAVILSLIGTAGIQVLLHRIIRDGEASGLAIHHALRFGLTAALAVSTALGIVFYPYFTNILGFSYMSYAYFVILLVMHSIVWVIMAVFWATEKYQYPAVIFSFAYLSLFGLTYGLHLLEPRLTLVGYTAGVTLLLLYSALAVRRAFVPGKAAAQPGGLSTGKLFRESLVAMLFHVFYAIALFLDKIIVWVWLGMLVGSGIVVSGSYTVGAFLGLMPTLSASMIVYLEAKTGNLLGNLFEGRLVDIRWRTAEYKRYYWKCLAMTFIAAVIILGAVAVAVAYFMRSPEINRILLTVGAGAVLFSLAIYNAFILPFFGKMHVSLAAMLLACLAELASIPFLRLDIWFAAVGFLAGSLLAFAVTQLAIMRFFSVFDFNIFQFATNISLRSSREGKNE